MADDRRIEASLIKDIDGLVVQFASGSPHAATLLGEFVAQNWPTIRAALAAAEQVSGGEQVKVLLEQIVARANSRQNADGHVECMRQLDCIGQVARFALASLTPTPNPTGNTSDFGAIATALGFLSSCIKSGEEWSPTCEEIKNKAFDALARLGAATPPRPVQPEPSQEKGWREAIEAAAKVADNFYDWIGSVNLADKRTKTRIANAIRALPPPPAKAEASGAVTTPDGRGGKTEQYRDALERIALLDECSGHELTVRHAFEAVAIATSTLGKDPSAITFEREKKRGAMTTTNEQIEREWKYGEVENDLNVALNEVIEKHRGDPGALAMAFMAIIETLGSRIEGFEKAFDGLRDEARVPTAHEN